MSGTPTPATPIDKTAIITSVAGAAGAIASTILTMAGLGSTAALIPLTESLLATAIHAFTVAHGTPPTVAQLQALLGDVPLVPPTS